MHLLSRGRKHLKTAISLFLFRFGGENHLKAAINLSCFAIQIATFPTGKIGVSLPRTPTLLGWEALQKNIPTPVENSRGIQKQPAKTSRNLNSRLKKIQRKIQKIQSFQHLVEKSFLSFPLSKSGFYINTQKFHKITDFRLKTGRNFRRSQAPCGKREKFSTGNSSVFLKIPWITG